MIRKRHTEEQIIAVLKDAQAYVRSHQRLYELKIEDFVRGAKMG